MKTARYLSLILAALIAAASSLPAAAADVPFTLRVQPAANQPAPALQSFAFAQHNGMWLIVGGRTNGFHRTSTPESTFPSQYENRYFYVVDPVGDREWKVAIPDAFQEFLSATNTEFYHEGDLLVIVGGYGSNCAEDLPSCYLTYPRITFLDVPRIIAAITSGQTGQLSQHISSLEDERFRVTGGGLSYANNYYYLVLGQNYDNIYKGAYTGKYTEEIRVFALLWNGTRYSIADYLAYRDPSGASGPDSQFHRRDLNMVETFGAGGKQGITVYGGVFTKDGGGWRYPINIEPGTRNTPTVTVDTSFAQKTSQYECAHLLMFDRTTNTMYTSLFGGISYYYYNAQGQLEESNLDNWLPFVSSITTLARDANGTTTEVVQPPSASLPALLGANAVFAPEPSLPHMGNTEVIDYSRLPPGNSILVGRIYGGIRATAPQSSQFNPTFANNMIYEVYLERATP
jgi:hypothetical protein